MNSKAFLAILVYSVYAIKYDDHDPIFSALMMQPSANTTVEQAELDLGVNGTSELVELGATMTRPNVQTCVSWGDPHIVRFDGKKYDKYTANGESMLFCSNNCQIFEKHSSTSRPTNKQLRIACGGVDKVTYNGNGQLVKSADVKHRTLNNGQSRLVWPDNKYPGTFKNEFIVPGLDAKVYANHQGYYIDIGITVQHLKGWTCANTKEKSLCTDQTPPPWVPPVKSCKVLDGCCARFKDKDVIHGCKEDYHDPCCAKGGNEDTCCSPMDGTCKVDMDCDVHEKCDVKSGLCRDPSKRDDEVINLDFAKLVHEKFSQEAAHGTWNLHLNLDTDPCSLLTCKAESQCHAVGTCTKAGGGVCTTPFLAKGTECDDDVEETDSDVCDGEGGCAGINIGLGCLEMRFDASKFKEGHLVTKWEDLAKKGHDATAHSTVPRVLLDQTDKKRPYVPVIKGKWWNVPGNTFLKTIVSVFRSGDGKTGWHGHGATLARRSGRNSNWLFENGNGRLHSNQYPDKVWKNGKSLTKPFDMAPINKFFVLVVQVNDRDKSAKTYYLGRGDADTSRVDIQEELGYDRILTDVERKQVESYLMKKWNIEN